MSTDGDYAIVAGRADDGPSAYIFFRSGTTWTEQAKLTALDAVGSEVFGESVSISGEYAIMGADQDDDNGSGSGSAYVFKRSGTTWTQQAKLTASDATAGDRFGHSVCISGDYVIVGAHGNDDGGSDSGSAYIFFRSGTTWTEQAKVIASDGAAEDQFGFSVSISGDHAIVGARGNDDDGESSGSAYVYYTIPLITFHAAALDMGSVPPGVTRVDSVFVTNQGTAELSVSAIAVSGTDAALFTATPSTLTVAGGASAYVRIVFAPITDGNFSAALRLTHNAPGSPVQVALTGSAPAPEVTLSLGTAFGAPENTVSIPVAMTNLNTGYPVGGLQFSVLLGDTVQAHFAGLEDTLSNAGFTVSTNTVGDSTRLIIFSTSGATIPPGTDIPLATLVYVLDPAAVLGSTIGLSTVNIEVADSLGLEIAATALDGELQIGIRGDVNLDGDVSILDLVKLVIILIGESPAPQIGTTAYNIADANADGTINIVDVIFQINTVLGIAPKLIASGPTAPVIVSLDAVHTLSSGQTVVPVVFDANGLIAGAQFTFTFDPAMLTVGTPYLVGEARGLVTDSHVADGMMRAVVYGVTPGAGIKAGQVLYIPVTVRDGSPSLTLTDIILVNPSAQRVEVTPGETTVVVKDVSIPTSFALDDARPNPFNPSTTIAYEVPEQTHITLTVYNMLGQEVVTLMDQVQAAGRYEVVWHGVNSRGAGVASGVYLYRIVSGSGYVDTKRMTLLK